MSSATDTATLVNAEIRIRPMTEHDLLEVVEIEESSGLSRWGWSAYYAELQSVNRSLMLVARLCQPLQNGANFDIAGYIAARFNAGELHINNVAVREVFRGKGLGSALLNHVLEEGKVLGATAAFLEVRYGNIPAQGLYKKCGFELVGRRKNYYSDPPEDALIMSAKLDS